MEGVREVVMEEVREVVMEEVREAVMEEVKEAMMVEVMEAMKGVLLGVPSYQVVVVEVQDELEDGPVQVRDEVAMVSGRVGQLHVQWKVSEAAGQDTG